MPEDLRIWRIVEKDDLKELKKSKLNLEERIEEWITKDISIVSDDLLVIGRQVETDFGGVIDILCLDRMGDVVIIELKRDKTPREITAQVLDYASWVKDLSNEKITEIANEYLRNNGLLDEAFRRKFDEDLPDILNEHHKMLIVASDVDSSSERIINYLSDTYGVNINAITFHYFVDEYENEYLARIFLIEPKEVEYRTQTKTHSKRKPPLSYEELREMAERAGVSELYEMLLEELPNYFDGRQTTRSSVAFEVILEGSRKRVFSLLPGESDSDKGLKFQIYVPRMAQYFGIDEKIVESWLPENRKEWKYYETAPSDMSGCEGYFKTMHELNTFLEGIKNAKNNMNPNE
ncbi:MAG: DUF91 domain-containing protein [Thermoplasmata archaeon]|nr:DUF91 domain-containing protein [Thermoplasmata archaeon]